jgi:Uma2 family endonuclease
MSTAPDFRRFTLREYFDWEETQTTKHEFYRGEVFAMAGASLPHIRISRNILTQLTQQLEGRECEAFGSDLRVRVDAVDLSTYPDITIVCGEPKIDPVDRHAITNPRVIFEVLSKSTENYDRGDKFEFYQHLESFREYVVVSQKEPRIVHYVRQDDGAWKYRLLPGMNETLRLETVGCELPFAMIYRNVEFGPEAEDTAQAHTQRA